MLLIGSRALREIAPELVTRNPKDYDLIATEEEFKELYRAAKFTKMTMADDGKKIVCFREGLQPVEVEIAWPGMAAEMLMGLCGEEVWLEELGVFATVPRIEVLYALKMSHRFRKNSPHFQKTRQDIKAMREAGVTIPDHLQEFFKLREKETYPYKHPNLNVKKDDFFTGDGVTYVYDHDSIHLAVAYPGQPAYRSFQEEGAQVKVSRDMWNALSLETQLRSVLEESYVLALERSQIPFPGKLTPRQSFLIALEKVCTSITSGWWRTFAYDHYDEVLAMYSDDYVEWLRAGVESGLVKPYTGEKYVQGSDVPVPTP